jgi:hypothetical protein
MKLLMQFSPTSCHSPNILSTMSSTSLSLCSSLNVRNQVLYLYTSTGKIIVLTEDKTEGSGLNGSKHYQNLTSS